MIRYLTVLITWLNEEIEAIDITMLKLLPHHASTKIQECIRKIAPNYAAVGRRKRKGKRDHHKDKMLLHGIHHQQMEDVFDIEKTYRLLEKSGLKESTEALIMAAQ